MNNTFLRLFVAVTIFLPVLVACTPTTEMPPSVSPAPSYSSPHVAEQELGTLRREVEIADSIVRLRKEEFVRTCPSDGPIESGNAAMCQVMKPGPDTLQGKIIAAANRCRELAADYNESANNVGPGHETVILGQTDNQEYGGKITCD